MKTTLELPDDLVRAMKLRAVREGKKLKYVAAELLRAGLDQPAAAGAGGVVNRVEFPLVECGCAAPGEEVTPERVAEILTEQEAEAHGAASG